MIINGIRKRFGDLIGGNRPKGTGRIAGTLLERMVQSLERPDAAKWGEARWKAVAASFLALVVLLWLEGK